MKAYERMCKNINLLQCMATYVCACAQAYPASQQQPGAVSSSIVCKAHCDTILGQLMRVSSTNDMVSLNLRVGNLDNADIAR